MCGPPENDFLRGKTAVGGVYPVAAELEVTSSETKCSKRECGTAVTPVWEDGKKVYVNGSIVGGGWGRCPENSKDVAVERGKRDGSMLRVGVKLERFDR